MQGSPSPPPWRRCEGAPPPASLLWPSDQPCSNDPDFKFNMEDVVSVCKRRGFIFQSSEIYNGFNGFYDYGPLGVELKQNIKKTWWRDMVHRRDDMVGLDSSIIASPSIWKSSGHVDGFSDPMVDCKVSKMRYRADQLFFGKVETEEGEMIGCVSVMESGTMQEEAEKQAKKMMQKAQAKAAHLEILCVSYKVAKIDQRRGGEEQPAILLCCLLSCCLVWWQNISSAQGIFVNFKNVQQTARTKVPFGIAQVGKAFRNEITPRNFIFRSREFEQMEIEYFIPPDDDAWPTFHKEWIDNCWNWLLSIGVKEELIDLDVHAKEKLAHYARACTDIAFKFPFGRSELLGVAARGDFDLKAHGRGVWALPGSRLLSIRRRHRGRREEERSSIPPSIAPIKCAVFPLVKNKPEIVSKAREIYEKLQMRYNVVYETSGAIGRRYRRMDEVGTPFCVTVDFDSLEDDTVTIRERDSTEQRRIKINELYAFLSKEVDGI
ncbi:hypothetical protein GUITHDRAFT_163452 [Guillardia theta CCMP2712]|uniref:Aminoacyl-transfer RNA synthetases class-II family profile domain-containing protein n=1 Tax=Guillardia theta (strain CCMP2712) TaxID=905079 RepID=L1J9Q8_GUITC|nr:hypothetical protein GUITHDRAFT_163452 [Guillardia theta CCMP2712]EKX44810.1 hypothetical protein GUITHDRAFT_163452 [Guillardia theta CCMP2712]|eukprot:XP_005831790.1 hypothetical protein GUITHDRAFT_163452 [Guillardia theta CCMP2712]